MSSANLQMTQTLARAGVIPVVTVSDPSIGVQLAKSLVAGGLDVIEVVLRTEAALDAVRAIREHVPECTVGVGTVVNVEDFLLSEAAGAAFAVSPGFSPRLLQYAASTQLAYLPAVSTPAEVLQVQEAGFETMKLFPSELHGGVEMLKALSGPFPKVRFCCTGGIKMDRLSAYRAQKNVVAIGASFMVPERAIAEGNWGEVTRLAIEARIIWDRGESREQELFVPRRRTQLRRLGSKGSHRYKRSA